MRLRPRDASRRIWRCVVAVLIGVPVVTGLAPIVETPAPVHAAVSPPVYPDSPPNALVAVRQIVNGSFEVPVIPPTFAFVEAANGTGTTAPRMPGWQTTHSPSGTVTRPIEVWTGTGPGGLHSPAHGSQYIELNAFEASAVFQDLCVQANEPVSWSTRHRARRLNMVENETNTMRVTTSLASAWTGVTPPATFNYTSGTRSAVATSWATHTGTWSTNLAPTPGVYRFAFQALSGTNGVAGLGNLLDDVRVNLSPVVDFYTTTTTASRTEPEGERYYATLRINGEMRTAGSVTLRPQAGSTLAPADYSVGTPVSGTGGAVPAGVTATKNADGSITVTFPARVYSPNAAADLITIPIQLVANDGFEPAETLSLGLASPTGAGPGATTLAIGASDCSAVKSQTSFTVASREPAVRLAKSVTPSPASPGSTLTYTVTLTNPSLVPLTAVAPSLLATDDLTGAQAVGTVSDVVAGPGLHATVDGGALLISGTIPAGATRTVTYELAIDPATTATAVANTVAPASPYVTCPTAEGCTTTTPIGVPALTIAKTAVLGADPDGDGEADVGDTVAYGFVVTNTGTVPVSAVAVTDARLASVGIAVTCTPAALAPAGSATCSPARPYTVTQADIDAAAATGDIVNTATARATPPGDAPTVVSPPATAAVPADTTALLTTGKSTATPSYARAGDVVTYSLSARNDGATTLTGVQLSDPGATIGSCTPAAPATLAPGATLVCPATRTATQADVDAGAITNVADSSGTDPAGAAVDGVASPLVTVPAVRTPELTVRKTTSTESYDEPGDVIDYVIQVTNSGNVTLAGVTVGDPVADAGTLQCTPGTPVDLAPAASITCTAIHTVDAADLDAGSVANTATAAATGPTGALEADSNEIVVPAVPEPSLATTKTARSPSYDELGEVVTYDIAVTNTGNVTLTGVTVTDPQADPGSIECAPALPATMPIGTSLQCTATHTVTQADLDEGEIVNVASAAGTPPSGPDVSARSLPVTVPAVQRGEVTVDKVAVDTSFDAVGDVVDYTITATNTGNVTIGVLTVVDPTSDVGSLTCDPTIPLGSLPPGATVECTATRTATQADLDRGEILNTAIAEGRDPAGSPISGTDGHRVPADQQPELTVTKVARAVDYAAVGDALVYDIVVTNTGNVTLTGATVADDLADPGTLACAPTAPVPTLDVGASTYCTATHTVTADDIASPAVVNTALATATPPSGPAISASATATVPRDLRADLAVEKLADPPAEHVPGQPLRYTISVTNHGPSVAADVTVDDPLPAALGEVAVDRAECAITSGVLTCAFPELAIGASETIVVTGVVDQSSTSTLVNTATVAATTPDPDDSDNTSTVTTTAAPTADLRLGKFGPASFTPGEPMAWVMHVDNLGPSRAVDLVVSDQLPPGVTFDAASSDARCSAVVDVVTCAVPFLDARQGFDLIVGVTTAPTLTDPIVNTASVGAATPDADTGNNADSETTPTAPEADVVVHKAGPAAVVPGTQFDYTIAVTNQGPSLAQATTMTDTLPAGLTPIAWSPAGGGSGTESCTIDGQVVTCDLGPIPANTVETITVRVQAAPDLAGPTVDNTAAAAATTPDPFPSNNAWTVTSPVTPQSDVAITKTALDDPVTAGELATYVLTVHNDGPSDAAATVVADALPPELVLVSATPSQGTCAPPATGEVTCEIGTVTTTAPVTVVVVVRVTASTPADTVVTNTATVDAPSDTDAGDNAASASVTVAASADLSILKTSSPNPYVPGQAVTYVLSVLNEGPSDAQDVVVTDPLPAGFRFVAVDDPACRHDGAAAGGTLTCEHATLAAGQQRVVVVTGLSTSDSTELANVASVESSTPDPDPTDDRDDDVNVGAPSADIGIVKSGPLTPVAAGTTFDYTLAVTNAGPSDVPSVDIDDQLPPGLAFVGATVSDGSTCDATVACTTGPLVAGGSLTVTITAAVPADMAATTVTNHAQATSPVPDPDPDDNADQVSTSIVTSADVMLTKIAQGSAVVPGGQRTYRIRVDNAGPSVASAVVVSDTLPDGLTFASATGASCDADAAGTTVTCQLGDVAPTDDPVTITLVVDVAPHVTGPVTNTAVATSPTPDPAAGNNDDAATDGTAPLADLAVTKTAPASALAGTSFTYLVGVSNLGPSDATGVVLDDALPAALRFAAATVQAPAAGSCDHDGAPLGGLVTCALGTVPAGGTVTIEVLVDVPADTDPATVTNTATASSATPELDPDDNAADVDTAITTQADVGITKVADLAAHVPGEPLTYTLTVRNHGPSDARDVRVEDPLPDGLTLVAADAGSGSCSGAVTCQLGTMAAGEVVTITIEADVDPAQLATIVNVAEVTSSTPDGELGNNHADTATDADPAADLAIDKEGPATAVAGTPLTYRLTVRNDGPSDARDVVVTDPLPPSITGVAATVTTGTGSCAVLDGTVTCSFARVAWGTAVVVTITGTVAPDVPQGATITNTAAVAASTPDPDDGDNTDDVATTVETSADVAITKTIDVDPIVPGRPVAYTLVLTNAGPSDARDVTVTDPVPDGLSYTAAVPSQGTCAADGACALGTIAAGGSATITITADTADDLVGVVTNRATVEASTPDPVADDNVDELTADVAPAADLAVAKTAGADTVVAGEELTYTVVAENRGPSAARDVELADAIPTGTTYVGHELTAGEADCAFEPAGIRLACSAAALSAGERFTVELTVRIDPAATGAVVNTAAVASATTTDPDPSNDTSSVETPVDTSADLRLTKAAADAAAVPGTPTRYVLTVTNDGPSTAQDVVVTDPLPDGVTATAVTTTVGTCAAGASVSCAIPSLSVGATATMTVDVDVHADVTGDIVNVATADATTPDPDEDDNTATATLPTAPSADLAVTKRLLTSPLVPGSPATFEILVTNRGPSVARDVVVDDAMPAGLTATAATTTTGECVIAAGDVRCALDDLAPDATVGIRVVAATSPTLTGTVSNVATVRSATGDPDPDDNEAMVSAGAGATADLRLTKRGPARAVAGTTGTYVVAVTNDGPSAAAQVVVTDALPATMTYVSSTPGCAAAGTVVTCTVDVLQPGATVTLEITVRFAAGGTADATNTASVRSATPDRDEDDQAASATTRIECDCPAPPPRRIGGIPATGTQVAGTLGVAAALTALGALLLRRRRRAVPR